MRIAQLKSGFINISLLLLSFSVYGNDNIEKNKLTEMPMNILGDNEDKIYAYQAGNKFFFMKKMNSSEDGCDIFLKNIMLDINTCKIYEPANELVYRHSCLILDKKNPFDAKAFYYQFGYKSDDFNHIKNKFHRINKEKIESINAHQCDILN